MATIKTFNITAVELDKVKFAYSFNSGADIDTDNSDYNRITKVRTETTSWSFSTDGGISTTSTSPCSYVRGGSGETTCSLTATLTTKYTITEYDWKLIDTYITKSEFDDLDEYIDESIWISYEYLGLAANKKEYRYRVYVYEWDVTSQSTGTDSNSKDVDFYPHPAEFTFKDCISGKQWKVDNGINSLITNITDFQGQAQQRKNWKHQLDENFSKYGQCPSFFNDNNTMTRNQMNAVYRYVKEESSNYEEFKKEDEKGNPIYHPISAKMFNDLADIINEKKT